MIICNYFHQKKKQIAPFLCQKERSLFGTTYSRTSFFIAVFAILNVNKVPMCNVSIIGLNSFNRIVILEKTSNYVEVMKETNVTSSD